MKIPLLKSVSDIPTREIKLHTRTGRDIENIQCIGVSQYFRNQFEDFNKKWSHLENRTNFSGIYNCHGLTFASRRTCINKDELIPIIIKDDDYQIISRDKVCEGDIIIYKQEGKCIHSGIIVGKPNGLNAAKVLSKCGCYGEYIHDENDRIYSYDLIEYYRINDEDTGLS